jgi:hypothetical protein
VESLQGWEVYGWVVGLLIPLGVALLHLDDYRLAKLCFAFAALALDLKIFMWGTVTQQSFGIRSAVVIVSFGLVGLFLVESFRYVDTKKQSRTQTTTGSPIAAHATPQAAPAPHADDGTASAPAQPRTASPTIEQHSTGANSPNVVTGDNSPVDIK